jgi:hypothetical protein
MRQSDDSGICYMRRAPSIDHAHQMWSCNGVQSWQEARKTQVARSQFFRGAHRRPCDGFIALDDAQLRINVERRTRREVDISHTRLS